MALVLHGTVVTMGVGHELADGAVYVGDDGLIEGVAPPSAPPPAGYEAAPRLHTEGVIYPGLVDLHNHIAYNFLRLWVPPRAEPYTRRDQWPREEEYAVQISDPTNALGTAAGKALLKYAEVKALVGGATSVQGSAKVSRPYEGWLVRNVEFETFGTGDKGVYQSVRTLGGTDFPVYRQHMADGFPFLYHLAEGTSEALLDEFRDLQDNDCLSPRLVAIHATALGQAEFGPWGAGGGAMVWSPLSNVVLYRATTDVVAAGDAGLTVCLGSDWGPSGSKNILGELKVADLWNREHLGDAFTARELVELATVNPARALGWSERLGRIEPGLIADLLVTARRNDDPYRNLIEATERHVLLSVVGGSPVYGTGVLMRAAGVPFTEPIYVAGILRTIRMLDPAVKDADMTWAEVVQTLEMAREDPGAARSVSAARDLEEPLRLIPDMPGDEQPLARALDTMAEVVIPAPDSLFHDAEFFRTLDRAPIPAGLLAGLRAYYD